MYIQDLRLPLEKGAGEAYKIYRERIVWIGVAGLIGIVASIVAIYPISSLILVTAFTLLFLSLAYASSDSRQLSFLLVSMITVVLIIMLTTAQNKEQELEKEYSEGLRRLVVK